MSLQFDYSNLKRVCVEAVIIVCFAMAIGLAFNHQMLMASFSGKVVATALPDAAVDEPIPVPVTLQDVQKLMNRSVLIDARIAELYRTGHLPGAVSLPMDEVEERLPVFSEKYPGTRSLIVYCNGYGCIDSYDLAVRLLRLGYNDVMVYEAGYPEWRDAGLPVEGGTP
ncbi:MAG: rhodanese-like domain-containing protein [Desulfuromonas sp.]|nr:MAG: rhodanese-like domain-containing protein [Desulfuromonas sp.]